MCYYLAHVESKLKIFNRANSQRVINLTSIQKPNLNSRAARSESKYLYNVGMLEFEGVQFGAQRVVTSAIAENLRVKLLDGDSLAVVVTGEDGAKTAFA